MRRIPWTADASWWFRHGRLENVSSGGRGCAHRVRPCPGGLGYPFKAHRGFAQVSQVLSHSPVFLHDNPSAVRPRTYNHDSPCFLQFYSKNRPGKLTRHCASCLVHVLGHAGPSRSHGLRSSCHTRNSVVVVAFVPAECLFNTNLQSVCPAQRLQAFVQHKTCRVFVQREACRAFVQREACRAFVQHKACRVFVQREAQDVCVFGCFNANLSMPKGVSVCVGFQCQF